MSFRLILDVPRLLYYLDMIYLFSVNYFFGCGGGGGGRAPPCLAGFGGGGGGVSALGGSWPGVTFWGFLSDV